MTNNNSSGPEEVRENEELTPGELYKKHMENKEHQISDDELQKVEVGKDNQKLHEMSEEKLDELEKLSHQHDLPNPYDVMGE